MAESLKDKTVKGTFWSAADAFLSQGVGFFVSLVLARLLTPSEYGLIGICFIFTTILNGIVDCGFSNALIRKKDTCNDDYNTMFITNMVFSIILFILLYLGSPTISYFFCRPELVALVRVMGTILIINSISITQATILTKHLDFKTKTKASLISAIISGIAGISFAFAGYGVWALVIQQVSKQAFYSICLCFFNKWLPSFSFSFRSFKYMWGFGWKLMLSGLLANIWNQLYQIVVGKYYSPATLGQYSRSKEYANIFSSNITTIVQRVTYPVLAEMQDDKDRMIIAYKKIIKITMFITCICLIPMGAIAEPLIYCLIGPQWSEAATYLPLICISMSLYPLHAINLNMLQVQGRSDIFLYLEVIKKIIAVFPICVGIFVSVYWMLIASIITGIISFRLNSYYTGKEMGYSSFAQIKDVMPSYGISFFVSLIVFFLKYLPVSYWIVLPLQLAMGAGCIIIVCETIRMEEYFDVKKILLSKISKNK